MKNEENISALAKKKEGYISFIKIWVHLIFSTKNREPHITNDLKPLLITHIRENAKEKGIYLDFIKGESSFWVNRNKLSNFKFEWKDEYIAISVSESVIPKVREYIKNQEEHHRLKTFSEEYDIFIKKCCLLVGQKP